jgi:hypothetical protein
MTGHRRNPELRITQVSALGGQCFPLEVEPVHQRGLLIVQRERGGTPGTGHARHSGMSKQQPEVPESRSDMTRLVT